MPWGWKRGEHPSGILEGSISASLLLCGLRDLAPQCLSFFSCQTGLTMTTASQSMLADNDPDFVRVPSPFSGPGAVLTARCVFPDEVFTTTR